MPAERSRGSRRSGADGNQLVWTMPVEPPSPSGISFTTNVTPITFNEPETGPIETPESDLFPSASDPSSPRRPAHSKKKAENHIPRPPNAFILFRSSFIKSQHVSTEVETNHSTLSKIIGLTWQNLPEDERQVWHAKAKAALDDHKRKFPQYAFRPLHTKSKGGTEKRKVREVGPKDMKRCAKIAELLVEGKKGQELDTAIQEFDKYHVPEVETRFEAPMTEKTFRPSSSSVKVEDREEKDAAHPSSSSTSQSKAHSVSRCSSPGPPPPLIDPDTVPQYMLAPSSSPDVPPPTPSQTLSDNIYGFSSEGESSFDVNPFSFDLPPTSPLPPTCITSAAEESSFSIFNQASLGATDVRPSLSIDTSYPDPVLSAMSDWTRSSSPVSIPSTPYYPVSPVPGEYNTTLNSYSSPHPLRHTSSSLSLESTSSFESISSYEDFLSPYSTKDYDSVDPSVTSAQPYSQYSQETPIFIADNDTTCFMGPWESAFAVADDISLAKAQSQYQYLNQVDSLNIDFSTFIPSSLSLSQC